MTHFQNKPLLPNMSISEDITCYKKLRNELISISLLPLTSPGALNQKPEIVFRPTAEHRQTAAASP